MQTLEQGLRALGLAAGRVENAGVTAREGDLRFWEAAGEHGSLDQPFRSLVQRRRSARLAHQNVLGATENDESSRRRRRIEIGSRETVLERQDQRIAKRRQPGNQKQD